MSDTVIILQDECIIAAAGKDGKNPKITQIERIPVEGYGELMEQWKMALATYLKSHHTGQVKLVLPASASTARMSQIPYAPGKQLAKMAANVLAESAGEGTADYSVIQAEKKSGVSLCCGSADSVFLQKLIGMCMEIGLPLKEISVPMEGYLKILAQMKEYHNKTAIYLFFEENSVTSLLYKEGVYYYSTRSRLFSERGTLDFGTEIVRNISGLVQFYAAAKETTPITDVFYAGCLADDFEVSVEGIQNLNLKVQPLAIDFPAELNTRAEDYLPCLGAFFTDKKKELNLYQVWQATKAEHEKAQKGDLLKNLVFPAITLVLCMIIFVATLILNQVKSLQIRSIREWINDPSIQEQYEKANERKQVSSELATAIRQVDQATENLDSYPDLTMEMIRTIVDVSGQDMDVRVQTMDISTGTLTYNAVSRQVIDIPVYVQKLENTGLFESVDYNGYSYDNEQYTLMLSCVLKAEEVGGDAQ